MEKEETRCIPLDFGQYDDLLSQRKNQLLFIGSSMDDEKLVFSVYGTNLFGDLSWRSGELYFADASVHESIFMTLLTGNGRDRVYRDIHGQAVYFQESGEQIRKEELPFKRMFDVFGTGYNLIKKESQNHGEKECYYLWSRYAWGETLATLRDQGIEPVAFCDRDMEKVGHEYLGLPILIAVS